MRPDCKGNDEMGVDFASCAPISLMDEGGLLWAIEQAKLGPIILVSDKPIIDLIPTESNQWINTLLNSLEPNPQLGWHANRQ